MAATVSIRFEGKKIRIGGTFGGPMSFNTGQMLELGSFANKTVKERTRSGIGSDDAPFPPLSQKTSAIRNRGKFVRQREGYAAWKAAHGLAPIRDLWGDGREGGHMLDNSTVRYADDRTVKIAFTARMARLKALANERRTPFYSFSDADAKKIMDYAAKLWKSNVKQVIDLFTGRRRAA